MRTFILIIWASLLCAAPSCRAAGLPGAFWTESGRDTQGMDGSYTQGFVRQGVELARPLGGKLQAYGRYNWRLRSVDKDYFNSYTPYAGAMLSFKYVDVGAEFGWPHYTGAANGNKDYSVFANWFRYIGLKEWNKDALVKALPLSTWGSAAYDLSNQNGPSTMGWVKLEADLLWLPHDWMAGPFVSYDWRLRSHNPDYFDFSAVAAGACIGNGEMRLGAKYAWRDYPKLGRNEKGLQLFLNVYKAWDLGK